MQRIFSAFGEFAYCKSHECRGCNSPFAFKDRGSAESWLRGFKSNKSAMNDLRQMASAEGGGSDLSRSNDERVIAHVADLLLSGRLRICGPKDAGQGVANTERARGAQRTAEDRVIGALRAKTKDFSFEGGVFRFIRADEWPDVRQDERYQIVTRDEARRIIERMAAIPTTPQGEKTALGDAVSLLVDTNVGRVRRGLVLLRIPPVRFATTRSSKPAATPSQLARVKEQHWIEIELVGEDGVGVAGVKYSIVTPDNLTHTGMTDAAGFARLDNIVAGQCKISFPNLDNDAWYTG
jgi:hypothetical protein